MCIRDRSAGAKEFSFGDFGPGVALSMSGSHYIAEPGMVTTPATPVIWQLGRYVVAGFFGYLGIRLAQLGLSYFGGSITASDMAIENVDESIFDVY